jgi:hypothetical protein
MVSMMKGKKELALGMVEGEEEDYYHGCGAMGSTKFRTYLRSQREYWFRYLKGNRMERAARPRTWRMPVP